MQKVYYDPPSGTAPLSFIYAGKVHKLFPPDKYWKRSKEEYLVGKVPKGATRVDAPESERWKAFTADKDIWIPDDDKNDKLSRGLVPKPRNYAFLSDGALRELKRSKYRELGQWVKTEREITKNEENELRTRERLLDEQTKSHDEALAKLKREQSAILEREKQKVAEARERIEQTAMGELREKLKREILAELTASAPAALPVASPVEARPPVSAPLSDFPPSIAKPAKK